MKLVLTTVISLLALSFFVMDASAEPGRRQGDGPFGMDGPGFGPPGAIMERIAKHVDLDDVQRESIKNILDAAKPEIKALRERAKANRDTMRELQVDDPNRSSIVNNIAVENGEIATQGTLLFDRVHTEVHAVLTDEQRQTLEESRAKLREGRENRREKGRRGGKRGEPESTE